MLCLYLTAPDLTIQNHNTTMLHFAITRQNATLPMLHSTWLNFASTWRYYTLPLPNNTTQNLCETLPRFTLPLPRPDNTMLYHNCTEPNHHITSPCVTILNFTSTLRYFASLRQNETKQYIAFAKRYLTSRYLRST